ncbi:succinate dehydrogenase subunit 6, mitochondrial isoform X2 [Diospyros lotus]|uniref:succinate dehydrogenase subunit 6, mitochondrial isoform X2 n=1 Tax=Diospyros lotus TaxID=55363 RepID=UPI00225BA70F|nr:succinate dehydrogenase subunit 6, mitochondrial isoform X2 [Diospyros lotus]
MTDSSSQSFFRRHWEGYKEFWSERFSFLDNYSRFVKRDNLLPSWSDADVQEFIASDPVHGPTLRTAREAAKYGSAGAVIGAVSTAAVAWKYSRSLHVVDEIKGLSTKLKLRRNMLDFKGFKLSWSKLYI